MRKQLDPRIPTLINNGAKKNHRSFIVLVGDKATTAGTIKGGTCNDYPSLLTNLCLSPSDELMNRGWLLNGVLEYLFEVVSREDSKDSNRRKLYAICDANLDEDDDV